MGEPRVIVYNIVNCYAEQYCSAPVRDEKPQTTPPGDQGPAGTAGHAQGPRCYRLAGGSPAVGTEAVTPALLRPTTRGIPEFVRRGDYQDRPFRCKDCGMEEVWTAVQQRRWYEEAQGDVWTVAVRCRACRQRERARKHEARRVHGAGLAAKSVFMGRES